MISKESHEKTDWHFQYRRGFCRPDRGGHRYQVVVNELVAIAVSAEVLAEFLRVIEFLGVTHG